MIQQQICNHNYKEQVSFMPVTSSPLNWAITTFKNKASVKEAESKTDKKCNQGFLPIGKIDCTDTLKELAELITEGDNKLRYLIEDYLSSEDLPTRIRAAQIIGYVGCQHSLNTLERALQNERNIDAQTAIIKALGSAELDIPIINNLSLVAKNSIHSNIRFAAIEALTNQVGTQALARIRISELLKNELDKDNCDAILRGMMR